MSGQKMTGADVVRRSTRSVRRSPGRVRTAAAYVVAGGVCVLLSAGAASAQGWIEPRPDVVPAQWGVEKLRTNVTVRINGRVAEVEVEEWFRNNGGGLGEGDYVYPLPGEAVFSGYSLYQGDQELRGELMDATRAREIYEAIVRAKRDPALIELVGKGMLRARVFPIEPGQTRRIQLRYTQVLERAGDAVQFRYAAGTAHLPGVPVRVRRTTTSPGSAPLTFTLVVADGALYRDAFSPTHDIRVERAGGRMTVRPESELRGDFAVFLPLAERPIGISVATHRPAGEDGYFMLTLSPQEVEEGLRVPRDVTVVVDVSGSMSGEKMEQARRAMLQLIGTLGTRDRLRLVAFSNMARQWREGWSAATPDGLRAARAWIEDLRAEGGTNIHDALTTAFAEITPETRLPIVVFMTDGLPTNGETRPERIVAMAEAERGRARVFAFGVGYDVNTYLLDMLSEAARGSTQYVRPDEDVEQAVSTLAAKVRYPVLTDLELVRSGIAVHDVYPRELPDLFAGEELVLFGRFRGAGRGEVGVSGVRNRRDERYTTQVRFEERQPANDFIPRLWAARRLGDIDRQIRSAQADGASQRQIGELVEQLRATALRYGLLSEYTAYLVQEPGMVAFDAQAVVPQQAPPPPSGRAAVARADEARRSREVNSVAQMAELQRSASERLGLEEIVVTGNVAAQAGERVVAGRTFRLQTDVWRDVALDARVRTVDVALFSAAHFALMRALPELELIFRELTAVEVAGRRVTIRVTDTGRVKSLSDTEVRALVSEFR